VNREVSFHPRLQQDLNEILDHYETEAGLEIAARFEGEFRSAVEAIKRQPRHFSYYLNQRRFRRCKLPTFPHVLLFRETDSMLRFIVLKHVKRAPGYGLRRK
jgi:plasmid stabilization system protein ParE